MIKAVKGKAEKLYGNSKKLKAKKPLKKYRNKVIRKMGENADLPNFMPNYFMTTRNRFAF
jgi:hypothetical protein